jgi:hypothetical protein
MNNTAQDIEAMGHSVDVINSLSTQSEFTELETMFLKSNVHHLEIMLTKEHIIEDASDKSVYVNAIALGNSKL